MVTYCFKIFSKTLLDKKKKKNYRFVKLFNHFDKTTVN